MLPSVACLWGVVCKKTRNHHLTLNTKSDIITTIMTESIKTAVIAWNQRTTDREKLQHVYLVLLAVIVFVAGVASLINANGSRQLMYAAVVVLLTLATNFVVWSLLKTNLLDKLPRRGRTRN